MGIVFCRATKFLVEIMGSLKKQILKSVEFISFSLPQTHLTSKESINIQVQPQ